MDATARLQDRTKAGELVYLPFDTHLSPLGHQVVADLVAEKLGTNQVLAARARGGEQPP